MSEKLHPTGEKFQRIEASREQHENLQRSHESAHQDAEKHKLDVESVRADVERLSSPISRERPVPSNEVSDANDGVRWWSTELQVQALDRMLSSVRKRLSKPEKQLSKVVHQPVIEKLSDFGGKTIARPSGILFGGIFSFVGSLGAYLIARHLGGELRYSVFAVCFVGGFLLGLFVELGLRLLRLRKARS